MPIVQAHITPILAKDIRLPSLQTAANSKHPIAQLIYKRLPQLPMDELKVLRKYLDEFDPSLEAASFDKDDVASWCAIVNDEIRYRNMSTARDVISTVLAALKATQHV